MYGSIAPTAPDLVLARTSERSLREQRLDRAETCLVGLAIVLFPMNYFRMSGLYFTAGDLAAIAAFAVMLMNGRIPLLPLGWATGVWLLSFLCLAGGLLIGSAAAGRMAAGVTVFLQYAFSLVLLPMLFGGRSAEQTQLYMKIFVASIVVVMLHGAYVIHFDPNPNVHFVSPGGRLRALLERENATAAVGALAILFSFYLYNVGGLRPLTALLTMVPLCYGIVLTGSNTGTAATVAGLLGVSLFSGSFRQVALVLALIAAAMAAVIFWGDLFLPEIYRERVLGALSSGDIEKAGTFEDRMALIREALEVSSNTVFIGLGADGFRLASVQHVPVHNTYLILLTEGGTLSLLGLVGLLLSGVALAFGAMADPERRMRGALTLTVVLLFAAMLNAYAHLYGRFWHVPLGLALGLSAAPPSRDNRSGGAGYRRSG